MERHQAFDRSVLDESADDSMNFLMQHKGTGVAYEHVFVRMSIDSNFTYCNINLLHSVKTFLTWPISLLLYTLLSFGPF